VTVSTPIRAAVALDQIENRERIEAVVTGLNGIEVAGMMDSGYDGFAGVPEPEADVLLLVCGQSSANALAHVETAVRERPHRPVVVLFDGEADGLVHRVFEVGAEDIFALPEGQGGDQQVVTDQLAFTIQKAVARKQGAIAAAGGSTSRMICVLGPKGGSGKTLTAANLAVALAADGQRVLAVDLDLQFGDLGLAMGLQPKQTIYDLARSSGSLDSDKVEGYLARHISGLGVLLAPTRPDHANAVSPEFLRELYPVVREMSDYVIVDTTTGFTPEVISAIDASTDVCMVCALDTLALKNTKLGLETLALMGYDHERIKLVLNRADSNVGLSAEAAVAVVGRHPDVLVPSHRDVVRAINSGTPVALAPAASGAGIAFHHLARLYAAVPSDSGAGKGPRRLFGRRKTD
jgi:pilus assembly protein CpaE